MCKQKYAAWKNFQTTGKTPGKGFEQGRVSPKWTPRDDYCTLLDRVEASVAWTLNGRCVDAAEWAPSLQPRDPPSSRVTHPPVT